MLIYLRYVQVLFSLFSGMRSLSNAIANMETFTLAKSAGAAVFELIDLVRMVQLQNDIILLLGDKQIPVVRLRTISMYVVCNIQNGICKKQFQQVLKQKHFICHQRVIWIQ